MVYLMQDNMVNRLKLPAANGGESTIEILQSRNGLISFNDSNYTELTGLLKYFEIDFKVVLPSVEDQMYGSLMAETDSSMLMSYESYVLAVNADKSGISSDVDKEEDHGEVIE